MKEAKITYMSFDKAGSTAGSTVVPQNKALALAREISLRGGHGPLAKEHEIPDTAFSVFIHYASGRVRKVFGGQ